MAENTHETNQDAADVLGNEAYETLPEIAPVRKANAALDALVPGFGDAEPEDAEHHETDSNELAQETPESEALPDTESANEEAKPAADEAEPAEAETEPESALTTEEPPASEDQQHAAGIIPIDTIEAVEDPDDGPFVPQALPDDPVTSDGSASRDGVNVSAWRVSTLEGDQLVGISEPEGSDRKSRKTRRAHARSRKARSKSGRKLRGRTRVIVALLLVTAVCSAVALAVTYSMELWGGRSIPRVVGLSQGNAVELLEEKGFKVEVTTEPSDTVEGHVFEVKPEMGVRVPEGIEVSIKVGESRHIPEIVGMSTEEADQVLADAGATNVRYVKRNTTKKQDVVLEVKPKEGAVFMSSDEIVVYVSQHPKMPDIVGEVEEAALSQLKREGIPATRKYERGTADQRYRVIRTSPEAGAQVTKKVTVVVGDPLIDTRRLYDYLDVDAPHIVDFLSAEGFHATSGHTDDNGKIVATFQNDAEDKLSFAADPWSHGMETDQWGSADVMEANKRVDGVRLSGIIAVQEDEEVESSEDEESSDDESQDSQDDDENKDSDSNEDKDKEYSTSSSSTSSSQKKATTKKVWRQTSSLLSVDITDESDEKLATYEQIGGRVLSLFGLSGVESSCTQKDISLPSGTSNKNHEFYCCSGTLGNGVWTVLVRPGSKDSDGNQTVEVVVTYAPKSIYSSIDLEPFGGKVSDFVAYWDEYAG